MNSLARTSSMPVLFVGHGSPMNAIGDNPFRQTWLQLGQSLPRPKAILCVSAHWETHSPQFCTANPPKTIHDFAGFPAILFQQQYPAPGAPQWAGRIEELLGAQAIGLTPEWGLDHGAWSVLLSLFPQADVPVAQLSLARSFSPAEHFAYAQKLQSLRDEGVLLIGSGNTVHNLRHLSPGQTPVWAQQFKDYVLDAIERDDPAALIDYRANPAAAMAVPTAEHYLPLLYAMAWRRGEDRIDHFNQGFDLGSIAMHSLMLSVA